MSFSSTQIVPKAAQVAAAGIGPGGLRRIAQLAAALVVLLDWHQSDRLAGKDGFRQHRDAVAGDENLVGLVEQHREAREVAVDEQGVRRQGRSHAPLRCQGRCAGWWRRSACHRAAANACMADAHLFGGQATNIWLPRRSPAGAAARAGPTASCASSSIGSGGVEKRLMASGRRSTLSPGGTGYWRVVMTRSNSFGVDAGMANADQFGAATDFAF